MWGTAFAVRMSTGLTFWTAAHVLGDLGLNEVGDTKTIEMCDEGASFILGSTGVEVTVTSYDPVCDVASFDCNFSAAPFQAAAAAPQVGQAVGVSGYLKMPDGGQPDCGLVTDLGGVIEQVGHRDDCARLCFSLGVKTVEIELQGMSGSPVFDLARPEVVIAILNGAPSQTGGPPFVATAF